MRNSKFKLWGGLLIGAALAAWTVDIALANPPVATGTFLNSPALLGSVTNNGLYAAGGTPVTIPKGNFDLIIATQATAAQTTNTNTMVFGFDLTSTVPNGTTFTSTEQPLLVTNTLNGTNNSVTSWTRFTAAQLNGATAVTFDYIATTSATATTNNGVFYAIVPANQ